MIIYFVLLFSLSISSRVAQESQNNSEYANVYNNIGLCTTPHNEAGLCISLKDCRSALSILLKSTLNDTDIDYLKQSFCGYHQNMVMVCCPTKRLMPLTTTTTVRPSTILSFDDSSAKRQSESPPVDSYTRPPLIHTITQELQTNSQPAIEFMPAYGEVYSTISEVRTKISLLPQPGVCGISSFSDRVIGGIVSSIDEYPWIVLLTYKKSDNTTSFNCAGALINERYVLTAAHCITDVPKTWSLYAVRLGEYDISTDVDCISDISETTCSDPVIDIPIEKAIDHPGFTKQRAKLHNDIGLLRLSKPVKFTDWIQPICLPTSDLLKDSKFVNQTMQIAGWGRTELSSRSTVRLKASIDVVGAKECEEAYASTNIEIVDSQICAGGKSIDSCAGDSGGPLMGVAFDKQPYFFLAGIISFGTKPCAIAGKPGIYTRIGAYIDWIESNMEP